jgi:hypothetical protein
MGLLGTSQDGVPIRDRGLPTTLAPFQSRTRAAVSKPAANVVAPRIMDEEPEGIPQGMFVIHLIDDSCSTGDGSSWQVSQHSNLYQLIKDLNAVASKPRGQFVDQVTLDEGPGAVIKNPCRHDQSQRSAYKQFPEAFNPLVDFQSSK